MVDSYWGGPPYIPYWGGGAPILWECPSRESVLGSRSMPGVIDWRSFNVRNPRFMPATGASVIPPLPAPKSELQWERGYVEGTTAPTAEKITYDAMERIRANTHREMGAYAHLEELEKAGYPLGQKEKAIKEGLKKKIMDEVSTSVSLAIRNAMQFSVENAKDLVAQAKQVTEIEQLDYMNAMLTRLLASGIPMYKARDIMHRAYQLVMAGR